MIHFLYNWLGLDNATGSHYLFWSGAGSDISELALVAAVLRGFFKFRKSHAKHAQQLHDHIDYRFRQLEDKQLNKENV